MTALAKPTFTPQNRNYEESARQSFRQQGAMRHLGATLETIEPGRCVIQLPFNDCLTQQDGFFHAGVTSTIADSAGGYAAFTLMPPGSRILTVEFKINLLAPANGELLRAEGIVVKPGKTITVTNIEVTVHNGNDSKLCALVQQTAICINS